MGSPYVWVLRLLQEPYTAQDLGCQTVIFDDELSPGQQRSLEKVLGEDVRLADRTALILDIFGQRAATREGQLQVWVSLHPPSVVPPFTFPTHVSL